MDDRALGQMFDFVGKTPKAWADCVIYWLGKWGEKHPDAQAEIVLPTGKAMLAPVLKERIVGVQVRLSTKVKAAYFCIRQVEKKGEGNEV